MSLNLNNVVSCKVVDEQRIIARDPKRWMIIAANVRATWFCGKRTVKPGAFSTGLEFDMG